jgi:hypothetical protein
MLNWKREGTYVELGANDPVRHSNTALLAGEFGWKGVSYELDPQYAGAWKVRRFRDDFRIADATTIQIDAPTGRIDYLSVDLDPPEASLAALENALKFGVRFSVITFEHDVWRGDDRVRFFSRKLLDEHGYKLAVPDVRVRVEFFSNTIASVWPASGASESDLPFGQPARAFFLLMASFSIAAIASPPASLKFRKCRVMQLPASGSWRHPPTAFP